MAEQDVVVVSIGMMTAVGLTAAETAASVRSATARFQEANCYDKTFRPFTLAVVPEEGLPDVEDHVAQDASLSYRELRMLRLGATPLLECTQRLDSADSPVRLILALPELETNPPRDPDHFLNHFAVQSGGAFDLENSKCSSNGRAGGLLALGQAVEQIRSGQAEFVVAGAIDTFLDLLLLGNLDRDNRVLMDTVPDGFIPGEGAAFVLLASGKNAADAGLTPLAKLCPTFEGFEEGHLGSEEPYRGDGLAGALEAFLEQSDLQEPIREVYSSMNGESHWAKEWGVAFLRHQDSFDPDLAMHHPADCFGDTGAACGPLMVGLAALGISQACLNSPCLVYGSSDHGQRAVLAVGSP